MQVAVPVGAEEGDGQAKPGGKAHQLLAGVAFVDIVAAAVGEGFFNEVAAVGGGIDRDVAGPAAHAALQNGLEGGKVIVVGGEAEVIDEEDELQRIGRQRIHQIGDLVELVLLHLYQPQSVSGKGVGNGLDGAGLAGAGVAVEQHVVGGLSLQQGFGVGDDLFPLLLVAGEFLQLLGIGVLDGNQLSVFHGEHMVAGEDTVALGAHMGQTLVVILGDGALLRQPAHQKCGGVFKTLGQRLQTNLCHLVQQLQLPVQALFHHGRHRAPGKAPDAHVLALKHGGVEVSAPVVTVVEQAGFKLRTGAHKGGGIVFAAGVQQGDKGRDHMILQKVAEDHKTFQTQLHLVKSHH